MKVGDLVRICSDGAQYVPGGDVWHEFMGKNGIIVAHAKRLHIPAAKVMICGEIVEFDLTELEIVSESR